MKKHVDLIMYELRQDAKAFGIMAAAAIVATAVIIVVM